MILVHDMQGNPVHVNPRFVVSVQKIPEAHKADMAKNGNFVGDAACVEFHTGTRLVVKENCDSILCQLGGGE